MILNKRRISPKYLVPVPVGGRAKLPGGEGLRVLTSAVCLTLTTLWLASVSVIGETRMLNNV